MLVSTADTRAENGAEAPDHWYMTDAPVTGKSSTATSLLGASSALEYAYGRDYAGDTSSGAGMVLSGQETPDGTLRILDGDTLTGSAAAWRAGGGAESAEENAPAADGAADAVTDTSNLRPVVTVQGVEGESSDASLGGALQLSTLAGSKTVGQVRWQIADAQADLVNHNGGPATLQAATTDGREAGDSARVRVLVLFPALTLTLEACTTGTECDPAESSGWAAAANLPAGTGEVAWRVTATNTGNVDLNDVRTATATDDTTTLDSGVGVSLGDIPVAGTATVVFTTPVGDAPVTASVTVSGAFSALDPDGNDLADRFTDAAGATGRVPSEVATATTGAADDGATDDGAGATDDGADASATGGSDENADNAAPAAPQSPTNPRVRGGIDIQPLAVPLPTTVSACTDPLNSLLGTGLGAAANSGASDAHWSVSTTPVSVALGSTYPVQMPPSGTVFDAATVRQPAGTFSMSSYSAVNQWISATSDATQPDAYNDYWYQVQFNLGPAIDAGSFVWRPYVWANNSVVGAWVNGTANLTGLTANGAAGTGSPYGSTASSSGTVAQPSLGAGWVQGLNTVTFQVKSNAPSQGFALLGQTATCNNAPTLTVTKQLTSNRYAASDQFTMQIRTGSRNGTVVSDPANATTAGTGATITAGTGTTGSFAGTSGVTYYITEAGAGAADVTNYSATITCTNSGGTTPTLPASGSNFIPGTGASGGVSLVLNGGNNVSCVIRNTPPITLPLAPVNVTCTTDLRALNTGYNNVTGAVLANNATDLHWMSARYPGLFSGVGMAPVGIAWGPAYVGNTIPWTGSGPVPSMNYWDNFPPSSNGNWIHYEQMGVMSSTGDWWYAMQLNLDPTVDPLTFSVQMRFLADNSVAGVWVNNVLIPGASYGASNPYSYTGYNTTNVTTPANLNTGWSSGINTIMVQVKSGASYEGFAAFLDGTPTCRQPTMLGLTKALGSTRAAGGDQFTMEIHTGSPSGPVVSNTSNATTVGIGSTVAAGTGTTGEFDNPVIGIPYYFTERAADGTSVDFSNYTSTITCTNTNSFISGTSTAMPVNQPFTPGTGAGAGYVITLGPADVVSCVVTNTALLFGFRVVKTAENTSGEWAPMDGSTWALWTSAGGGAAPDVQITPTPGVTGAFDVTQVAAGNYWLVETSAPDGFSLLAAPLAVTVSSTGVVTFNSGDFAAGTIQVGSYTDPSGATIAQVNVRDVPKGDLPVAGGPGDAKVRMGGFSLAAVGVVGVWWLWRRRREAAAAAAVR